MKKGFSCNICGAVNAPEGDELHRELRGCQSCGSNARFRALMLALTQGLLGHLKSLISVEPNKKVRGFGCSDTDVYAKQLERLFDYKNTFLHMEPRVDICDWTTLEQVKDADFIICTDVLEHTIQQPRPVLQNLFKALNANGILVLSAPTYDMAHSVEKYPGVVRFENVQIGDRYAVVYERTDGTLALDTSPNYHGGPGSVLEMRLMSNKELHDDLFEVGFEQVSIPQEGFEEFGAVWPMVVERSDVSFPIDGRIIIARKGR